MRTGCLIRLVPDGCYRGTVGHDREMPASPVMPNAPFRPSRQCPFCHSRKCPFCHSRRFLAGIHPTARLPFCPSRPRKKPNSFWPLFPEWQIVAYGDVLLGSRQRGKPSYPSPVKGECGWGGWKRSVTTGSAWKIEDSRRPIF